MRSITLSLPHLKLKANADAYDLSSHTYRSVNEKLRKGSKLTAGRRRGWGRTIRSAGASPLTNWEITSSCGCWVCTSPLTPYLLPHPIPTPSLSPGQPGLSQPPSAAMGPAPSPASSLSCKAEPQRAIAAYVGLLNPCPSPGWTVPRPHPTPGREFLAPA